MQAPLPPQKKTSRKNKVWAIKKIKINWASNGFWGGGVPKILNSP
jgi:hypothetical protein